MYLLIENQYVKRIAKLMEKMQDIKNKSCKYNKLYDKLNELYHNNVKYL